MYRLYESQKEYFDVKRACSFNKTWSVVNVLYIFL
jgi:hypothetical protein